MSRLFRSLAAALLIGTPATAQESSNAALAQQLANPVANLSTLPFQFNSDHGFPGGTGERAFMLLQPVIPFSVGENWNLITRTIVPVYNQDISDEKGRQIGFGPTTQTFFFSPRSFSGDGLIWGAGPVLLLPTVSDDIANRQWGAGISGVLVKQTQQGFTMGLLANQIWSISDEDEYGELSQMYLQPFLGYRTPGAYVFAINTESTYDWINEEWSVPINLMAGKVFSIGNQSMQFRAGARYWADAPEYGPEGWGARAELTFIFPRK
ncbi:transporter [Tropicimonas sp.]|uniref:transporter n=1 Tax=Tropicimonas sp. TaxID=2067044 RepID=UPI003A8B6798